VWGYPSGIKTRTLDVHIGRLRRKLGEDGKNPRYITTVRAVGFRFDPREALSAGGEAAA
ncbi:MAG TPA: DNA-binding response regulator, partial [Armatimonadetes bacterium]|nr:DNA-binding response regulator [Armatimonadota bacterium]